MAVSPMNATFQQYDPQGPVSNNLQSLPVAYSSIPPPPVQNQVPHSDSAANVLTDQQAFLEVSTGVPSYILNYLLTFWSQASKSWPLTAQSLLKDLIIAHGLFAPPQTAQDHDNLVGLYESFYADIKILGMNLAKNDDILWQLFRSKVEITQSKMLRVGEIQQTPEGLKYSKLPQKKLFLSTAGKQPLSTPPTTPVLPMEELGDEMNLWNSSDSGAQARLFRKMLRTVKDPQRLMFEFEEYCAEARRKEDGGARDDVEPPSNHETSKETKTRSTQRPTPSSTPDPTSTSLDLKAMIDKRLCEMRRKRALERQVLESSEDEEVEESEPKRIKVEPLT